MDTGLYLGSFSYNVVLGNIYLLSDPTTETRVETEYRHSCLESAYKLCRWYEIEVIIERGQIGFLTHDLGRRDELLK